MVNTTTAPRLFFGFAGSWRDAVRRFSCKAYVVAPPAPAELFRASSVAITNPFEIEILCLAKWQSDEQLHNAWQTWDSQGFFTVSCK